MHKKEKLLEACKRAEQKIDFGRSNPDLTMEKLIFTDPTLNAVWNQFVRMDDFGNDEFFVTAVKILYKMLKETRESFTEVVERTR